MTDDEKKALTLMARSAHIAHHYGTGRSTYPTAGPAFLFSQAATPTVVLALLDELYEEQKTLRTLRDELGSLYATIFGDGGHRQAELDALGPYSSAEVAIGFDVFTGVMGNMPRRYEEAVQKLGQVFSYQACGSCSKLAFKEALQGLLPAYFDYEGAGNAQAAQNDLTNQAAIRQNQLIRSKAAALGITLD